MTKLPSKTKPIKGINTLQYAMQILVDEIAMRKVTGNAAKKLMQDVGHTLSFDNHEVLSLIIKRDLKCGINAKTIASVWPDLLPKNPYMRCGGKLKDVKYPALSQTKCDGVFVRFFVDENSISAKTRNGSLLLIDNFQEELKNELQGLTSGVYEGELLVSLDDAVLSRELGNGIINGVLIAGKSSLGDGENFRIVFWDYLKHEEFNKGKSGLTNFTRFSIINEIFGWDEFKYMVSVDHKIVKSEKEANEHYLSLVAQGEEGTVLKNLDGLWKDGTSKDLVKMKVEEVVELRCVGFVPAREGSKNEDTFGSLLCRSECGKVEVKCTGIPDNLRGLIWTNKDYYTGKVLSVKANGVMMSDSNDTHSLFLPRFVEFRDYDKAEADDLAYILNVFNQEE